MWLKLVVFHPLFTGVTVLLFYCGLFTQVSLLSNVHANVTVNNRNVKANSIENEKEFCSIINVIEKKVSFESENTITLVTQGSLDHAHHLVELSARWNGPISAAVFIPSYHHVVDVVSLLSHFHKCHHNISSKVTFHIFYPSLFKKSCPISVAENLIPASVGSHAITCDSYENDFISMKNPKYSSESQLYPVNVARNVAREGSLSEYELVADIELIPSVNFTSQIQTFLTKRPLTNNEVLVVPVFEFDHRLPTVPSDVTEIKTLLPDKLVVPFHVFRAFECHKIPEIERWYNNSNSQVEIFLSMKWLRPCWEPVYIARTGTVPYYDPRFKGYGKNKIQQVYEMCRADFDFHVATNVFLAHRKISKMTKREWIRIRDALAINNKLFENFQRELDERYQNRQTIIYCDKQLKMIKKDGKILIVH